MENVRDNPSFIQWWLGVIVFCSIWNKTLLHISQADFVFFENKALCWQDFVGWYVFGIFPFAIFMLFWFAAMEVEQF